MDKALIKKIIILLIILIAGYLIFSFFFNGKNDKSSKEDLGVFFPFSEEERGLDGGGKLILEDNEKIANGVLAGESVSIFRQITNSPIAGAIIFKENDTEQENNNYIIRYIEKATGHIYETIVNDLAQIRISNTTIPKIQEAVWINKQTLVIRYLDDNDIIKTFSAKLILNELDEQKLEGIFLQDNIREIIKFGEQLFYLLDGGNGSIGIISDTDGENKKIIFKSPLKEWLISALDANLINFTTKPSTSVYGFSFLFNTKTKNFSPALENKQNLSVNMNGTLDALYSQNTKSGPKLYLYDDESKLSAEIAFQTFPEKCVWGEKNVYILCGVPAEKLPNNSLDNWYKGRVSFSDSIWKLNTQTNTSEFLIPLDEISEDGIDIINPILTEDGNYLLFTNKKDYSLWCLRLKKSEVLF